MSLDGVDFEAITKVLSNRHVARKRDFVEEVAIFLYGNSELEWNSPEEKKCKEVITVLEELGYFKPFSHTKYAEHMIFRDIGKT